MKITKQAVIDGFVTGVALIPSIISSAFNAAFYFMLAGSGLVGVGLGAMMATLDVAKPWLWRSGKAAQRAAVLLLLAPLSILAFLGLTLQDSGDRIDAAADSAAEISRIETELAAIEETGPVARLASRVDRLDAQIADLTARRRCEATARPAGCAGYSGPVRAAGKGAGWEALNLTLEGDPAAGVAGLRDQRAEAVSRLADAERRDELKAARTSLRASKPERNQQAAMFAEATGLSALAILGLLRLFQGLAVEILSCALLGWLRPLKQDAPAAEAAPPSEKERRDRRIYELRDANPRHSTDRIAKMMQAEGWAVSQKTVWRALSNRQKLH